MIPNGCAIRRKSTGWDVSSIRVQFGIVRASFVQSSPAVEFVQSVLRVCGARVERLWGVVELSFLRVH